LIALECRGGGFFFAESSLPPFASTGRIRHAPRASHTVSRRSPHPQIFRPSSPPISNFSAAVKLEMRNFPSPGKYRPQLTRFFPFSLCPKIVIPKALGGLHVVLPNAFPDSPIKTFAVSDRSRRSRNEPDFDRPFRFFDLSVCLRRELGGLSFLFPLFRIMLTSEVSHGSLPPCPKNRGKTLFVTVEYQLPFPH